MAPPSTICLGVVNSSSIFFGRNSDHNHSDHLDKFTDSAPLDEGTDNYLGLSEHLVGLFDSLVFTFILKVTFVTGQDRPAGHIQFVMKFKPSSYLSLSQLS